MLEKWPKSVGKVLENGGKVLEYVGKVAKKCWKMVEKCEVKAAPSSSTADASIPSRLLYA